MAHERKNRRERHEKKKELNARFGRLQEKVLASIGKSRELSADTEEAIALCRLILKHCFQPTKMNKRGKLTFRAHCSPQDSIGEKIVERFEALQEKSRSKLLDVLTKTEVGAVVAELIVTLYQRMQDQQRREQQLKIHSAVTRTDVIGLTWKDIQGLPPPSDTHVLNPSINVHTSSVPPTTKQVNAQKRDMPLFSTTNTDSVVSHAFAQAQGQTTLFNLEALDDNFCTAFDAAIRYLCKQACDTSSAEYREVIRWCIEDAPFSEKEESAAKQQIESACRENPSVREAMDDLTQRIEHTTETLFTGLRDHLFVPRSEEQNETITDASLRDIRAFLLYNTHLTILLQHMCTSIASK
jgi:hypothetical protein